MKITIEVNGCKIELTEEMFEQFTFSLPRDVHHYEGNRNELGRAHMMMGGMFKDGVTPEWVEA
jgi:hypothetical protein